MPGHGGDTYKDLLLFLAAAGVVVPLFSRFRVSPVLGFLAAGVLLGPHGLGRFAEQAPWLGVFTITDRTQVQVLAELGVAFLLFTIGLELSWDRLKAMRRLVFGLGLTQVLLCSLVLAAGFLIAGQSLGAAVVAGLALGLSSTAVVMPALAERRRLKGAVGRTSFAVLLAQDLAVAPILITVTLIAALVGAGEAPGPAAVGRALLALAPAAIGLALLVVIGRLAIRPLFKGVARAEGSELFVAAALLVVVGAGAAAEAAGLSMSLGALVAGLLLAETEYRRAVEVHIEPFKGLLLGVFFVSVGIGLDLDAVAADPWGVVGLAAVLIVVKAGLIAGLARVWGVPWRAALEAGLVLGPAGEFAFVIVNTGMVEGLASPAFAQALLVSATLSLFMIPVLAALGERIARQVIRRAPDDGAGAPGPEAEIEALAARPVLVVGFGRVGRLVAELLTEHDQAWLAVDTDPTTVSAARREGLPVVYGDAGRPEMLRRLGVETARALVVTMDGPAKIDEVVQSARAAREDLILIARARDDRHAARLYALGVTDAVPETTEASLQLAENTLVDLGVPMGLVLASVHERRDRFRQVFQAAAPEGRRDRPSRALRATVRQKS